MALPVDVVGPRPRLGDVEAPPRSRSSLSSVAVVESEPLDRARRRPSAEAGAESEPWGRAKRCSSSSGAEPKSCSSSVKSEVFPKLICALISLIFSLDSCPLRISYSKVDSNSITVASILLSIPRLSCSLSQHNSCDIK
jgi:hypothetical protein